MSTPSKRTPAGTPPKTTQKIGRGQLEALRFAAETSYVFNLEPQTPKDLAARPEFKNVSEVAIANWAREGNWRDKRRAFLGVVRSKMEAHIADGMVQQSIKTLQLYDAIHKNLAAFLMPNDDGQLRCQPKSLESGIAALINLDKARAQARREISDTLGERVEQGATVAPTAHDLSPEQARRLAHAVMAAELKLDDEPQDPDPKA